MKVSAKKKGGDFMPSLLPNLKSSNKYEKKSTRVWKMHARNMPNFVSWPLVATSDPQKKIYNVIL